MQIKTNRKSGFTLVEIMIVVAIIGLLAAIGRLGVDVALGYSYVQFTEVT